jgi:hypothetical protein
MAPAGDLARLIGTEERIASMLAEAEAAAARIAAEAREEARRAEETAATDLAREIEDLERRIRARGERRERELEERLERAIGAFEEVGGERLGALVALVLAEVAGHDHEDVQGADPGPAGAASGRRAVASGSRPDPPG